MAFKELPLGEVSLNPFTKLDKEWGLWLPATRMGPTP